jgi:hypothetical protein
MKAWVLDKWKEFRATQKRTGGGVTVAGKYVWRAGGTIELLARFPDEATARHTLTSAGYKRQKTGIFKP